MCVWGVKGHQERKEKEKKQQKQQNSHAFPTIVFRPPVGGYEPHGDGPLPSPHRPRSSFRGVLRAFLSLP
jgi:hypothetical protein